MFKKLRELLNQLLGGSRMPKKPEPLPLPQMEEPEPEFFDLGQGYEGDNPDFIEVTARAKYSSKRGEVNAEIHFFLERDHKYTARQLQEIFHRWTVTGTTPKDVEIAIINWSAKDGKHTHSSSDYAGEAEDTLNSGLRAALRRANIDF